MQCRVVLGSRTSLWRQSAGYSELYWRVTVSERLVFNICCLNKRMKSKIVRPLLFKFSLYFCVTIISSAERSTLMWDSRPWISSLVKTDLGITARSGSVWCTWMVIDQRSLIQSWVIIYLMRIWVSPFANPPLSVHRCYRQLFRPYDRYFSFVPSPFIRVVCVVWCVVCLVFGVLQLHKEPKSRSSSLLSDVDCSVHREPVVTGLQ